MNLKRDHLSYHEPSHFRLYRVVPLRDGIQEKGGAGGGLGGPGAGHESGRWDAGAGAGAGDGDGDGDTWFSGEHAVGGRRAAAAAAAAAALREKADRRRDLVDMFEALEVGAHTTRLFV